MSTAGGRRLQWLLLAPGVGPGAGGGVARYTVSLARALARRPDIEVHLVTDGDEEFLAAAVPDARVHRLVTGRGPLRPLVASLRIRAGWAAVLRDSRFDVVHGARHLLPPRRGGAVRVLTVHDTILLDRPGDFPPAKRLLLVAPYRASLRGADRLLAVSAATATRLVDHDPSAADRIAVVGLAAAPDLLDAVARPVASLVDRRYVLVVGDGSARKNLALLRRTWPRIRAGAPGLTLVSVGPHAWGVEDGLVAAPDVQVLRAVADDELAWLYGNAAAVLAPSLLEGFGLPVAEALAFGVPVLASDDPALAEAGGMASAAWSDDAWVDAVVATVAGSATCRPAGSRRTWDDVAEETVAAARGATWRRSGGIDSTEGAIVRSGSGGGTRIGLSPFTAPLRVRLVGSPPPWLDAAATTWLDRGWTVQRGPGPGQGWTVLAVGTVRRRVLDCGADVVVRLDPPGRRPPTGAGVLVLTSGASRRVRGVGPVVRLAAGPDGAPDPDELAAVLARARAWAPPPMQWARRADFRAGRDGGAPEPTVDLAR